MEKSRELLQQHKANEAIDRLNTYIASHPESDEAYYLRGKAYQKIEDFRQALNNYLEAIHRNPNSPAQQAHDMLIKILNFYNKDMFNQ